MIRLAPSFQCCLCAALCLTVTNGQTLERSIGIDHDFSNQPAPRFKNGYLIARDADQATVRTFDKAGRPGPQARVALPGASSVRVIDATVSPAGELVVAASARQESGQTESVLAWFGGGTLRHVVRTSPYAAMSIVFSSDGSLWSAGRVYNDAFQTEREYDVVRQFDAQGREVRHLLPVSTFAQGPWHPGRGAILVSGGNTIGLFAPAREEWVEIDARSGEVQSRTVVSQLPANSMMLGAGIASDGSAYLGAFEARKGSILYRIDKVGRSLVATDPGSAIRTASAEGGVLLGVEQQDWVFYRKSPRGLDWVRATQ